MNDSENKIWDENLLPLHLPSMSTGSYTQNQTVNSASSDFAW